MTEPPEEFFAVAASIAEGVRERDARANRALAAYHRMSTRSIQTSLLVEYRCRSRTDCLLLRCWRAATEGDLFYLPPFKTEPVRNLATSVAAARAQRTTDGDRRWVEQAGHLDDLRELGNGYGLSLNCNHIQLFHPATALIADVDVATPGNPTRRRL